MTITKQTRISTQTLEKAAANLTERTGMLWTIDEEWGRLWCEDASELRKLGIELFGVWGESEWQKIGAIVENLNQRWGMGFKPELACYRGLHFENADEIDAMARGVFSLDPLTPEMLKEIANFLSEKTGIKWQYKENANIPPYGNSGLGIECYLPKHVVDHDDFPSSEAIEWVMSNLTFGQKSGPYLSSAFTITFYNTATLYVLYNTAKKAIQCDSYGPAYNSSRSLCSLRSSSSFISRSASSLVSSPIVLIASSAVAQPVTAAFSHQKNKRKATSDRQSQADQAPVSSRTRSKRLKKLS